MPSSVGYIYEPFNKNYGLIGIERGFQYIYEGMENEAVFDQMIAKLLIGQAIFRIPSESNHSESFLKKYVRRYVSGRSALIYLKSKFDPRVNRYLIKDPLACLASEWMHRKYGMEVVILIRHPAAYAASLKRMNWELNSEDFLSQNALIKNHLKPYESDLRNKASSVIVDWATMWNCIYSVLFKYIDRNSNMIAVRHEDLSQDPICVFTNLFERLNLKINNRIINQIHKLTNSDNRLEPRHGVQHDLKRDSRANIDRWRNVFTRDEITVIKERTNSLASRYYDESDW